MVQRRAFSGRLATMGVLVFMASLLIVPQADAPPRPPSEAVSDPLVELADAQADDLFKPMEFRGALPAEGDRDASPDTAFYLGWIALGSIGQFAIALLQLIVVGGGVFVLFRRVSRNIEAQKIARLEPPSRAWIRVNFETVGYSRTQDGFFNVFLKDSLENVGAVPALDCRIVLDEVPLGVPGLDISTPPQVYQGRPGTPLKPGALIFPGEKIANPGMSSVLQNLIVPGKMATMIFSGVVTYRSAQYEAQHETPFKFVLQYVANDNEGFSMAKIQPVYQEVRAPS